MDTRVYWIWLQQALGLGNPLSGKLLALYPHIRDLYEAKEKELEAAGCGGKVLRRLCDKALTSAQRILQAALQNGGWILTPDDDYYPSLLRGIYAMPVVLYGRGTMPDLDRIPGIAVAGTRTLTGYGRELAWELGAGLATGGMILVTGGTLGIETAAIEGALEAGGIVVDIQACELSREYPAPNTALRRRILEQGALLSECPPGVRYPNYVMRNRLISGMTWGVCVVEAAEDSGSLSIAAYAREQGRDVFAVPGAVTEPSSQGPNHLIQEGAKLVHCAADILEEYESRFPEILDLEAAVQNEKAIHGAFQRRYALPHRVIPVKEPVRLRVTDPTAESTPPPSPPSSEPAVCPPDASPTAKRVWEALEATPVPIDELADTLSLPVPQVLVALTELEVAGCVRNHAGQSYSRI